MARIPDPMMARIRKAAAVVARFAPVEATYVFGSRAWGDPDEHSDIDVAAFVVGAEEWDLRQRARIIADVQGAAGDDIELHVFPASLLPTPPLASLAHLIVRKGILLH